MLTFLLFTRAIALDNGVGRTPAMGWNSYNHFGACTPGVTEADVRSIADAFISTGLKDAGYEYLNLDDCWQSATRDAKGNIVADPVRFPNGMKAVSDYVHSLGLKFGLYSSAGTETCAGLPAGLGYERQDAAIYAEWEIDFLKYDNCGNNLGTSEENNVARYSAMRDALNATGRSIYYSLCNWGQASTWNWAQPIGNSYRIHGDIFDSFDGYSVGCPCASTGPCWLTDIDIGPNHCSFMSILDNQVGISQFSRPGAFGDMDILEIGNGQSTEDEYRSHFSLWAVLKSPLLLGNDIRNMSAADLAIVTNAEIIAVNQDPLGVAATLAFREHGWTAVGWAPVYDVWSGPLADGSQVVVVLNRQNFAQSIKLDMKVVGFDADQKVRVRDLWLHQDLGVFQGSITDKQIHAHSAKVYKIHRE